MSDVTICDKCSKVIDKSQAYLQVVVTELVVNSDSGPTVNTTAVTYDYHTEHAPRFVKGEHEEEASEEEPSEEAPE